MWRVFMLPEDVLLGGEIVCGKGMDGGRRCPTDKLSCPLPDALLLDKFSGCSCILSSFLSMSGLSGSPISMSSLLYLLSRLQSSYGGGEE
jgi:hypothetical protein